MQENIMMDLQMFLIELWEKKAVINQEDIGKIGRIWKEKQMEI